MPGKFEVHEHCYTSGPRSNRPGYKFEHSHFGGDVPHTHPNTGPASYAIDKDEWFRATGLQGGGRKKFTAKPSGEQLQTIPRTAEENTFEIHVSDPPPGFVGTGGGLQAAARMVLAFGMTARVIDGRGPERKRS